MLANKICGFTALSENKQRGKGAMVEKVQCVKFTDDFQAKKDDQHDLIPNRQLSDMPNIVDEEQNTSEIETRRR